MDPKKKEFKITDEELLTRVDADIAEADLYFTNNLLNDIIARIQVTEASQEYYNQKFPKLSAKCTITSTDTADTIEWILPSLMRIFWGGNDVVSVEGRTEEDNPEPMRDLINWQIQRKNRGFLTMYTWFKDALEVGLGCLKVWWEREFEDRTEELTVSDETFLLIDPKEIIDVRELAPGQYWVKVKRRRMIKNQPKFKNIPASEIRFSPIVDDDGVPLFVCHERMVTEDELRRKEKAKIYKGIDDAISNTEPKSNILSQLDAYIRGTSPRYGGTSEEEGENVKDDSRKRYLLRECFARYDIDGDGMYEPVIITKLGNKIIRKEYNTYGRPTFFFITALPKSYQVWGRAIADLLQSFQDLKTALLRQIVVNVSTNNDRRILIEKSQTDGIKDLRDDRSAVRIDDKAGRGIKNYVDFFPHAPLSPETFTFMEWIQGAIENKSGVTRYNQGLDADSLNKTAKGISAIMNAAAQRVELIARIFAETGVMDFTSFLVEMNQRWMDQDQVIRLTNKSMTIRPDDLKGEFDVVVSAGVGTGNKQQAVENMLLLFDRIYPKLVGTGIAGIPEIYNVVKKIIEEMGYKNISDYARDPSQAMNGMPPGVPGVPPIPGMMPPGMPMMPGAPGMIPPGVSVPPVPAPQKPK